jgi:hypothetical protein
VGRRARSALPHREGLRARRTQLSHPLRRAGPDPTSREHSRFHRSQAAPGDRLRRPTRSHHRPQASHHSLPRRTIPGPERAGLRYRALRRRGHTPQRGHHTSPRPRAGCFLKALRYLYSKIYCCKVNRTCFILAASEKGKGTRWRARRVAATGGGSEAWPYAAP